MNSNSRIISTDEDPSLRIESSAIINLRGVSTKLNKYIIFTMQTYKELINPLLSVRIIISAHPHLLIRGSTYHTTIIIKDRFLNTLDLKMSKIV